jgi:hypothetical protein
MSDGAYSEGATFGEDDSCSDNLLTDIDLRVTDRFGNTVDSSVSAEWNVEWAEWIYNSASAPYTATITPYAPGWDCTQSSEPVGWAWVALPNLLGE